MTTRLAAAIGIALAFVATRGASSQPADDALAGVAKQIEAIESAHGAMSPELITPLTNAGSILREQGDVALAAASFERARHLVRVNYGLSSFEEAPLLRQLIQIEEGQGDAAGAWALEQKLLVLIHRYPGPRAAPMLKEIADKRADVLSRYSHGEFPPQIMLGCYYAQPGAGGDQACPGSGSSGRVRISLLDEARSYYVDTIDMVVRSEGVSAPELPDLYMAWVRAIYSFPNDFITGYEGRGILREVHSLAVRNSEPLDVQMNALVHVADWDLLFARGRKENDAAFAAYQALYDELAREGLEQSSLDDIFAPSMPVVLPTFLPNPLASVEAPASAGYVDVAFDVTKRGRAEDIEILASATNTEHAATERLVELIDRSRFRPRVAAGVFEERSRVAVRYYVND